MSDTDANPLSDAASDRFDRIDELASMLIDEVISHDQFCELESLLGEDEESRARYLTNIQTHVDLLAHFSSQTEQQGEKPQSPILTMLGKTLPSAGDAGGFPFAIQPPEKQG